MAQPHFESRRRQRAVPVQDLKPRMIQQLPPVKTSRESISVRSQRKYTKSTLQQETDDQRIPGIQVSVSRDRIVDKDTRQLRDHASTTSRCHISSSTSL